MMFKYVGPITAATMLLAATYFRTTEAPGLFAIAWIGGLACTAAIVITKAFTSNPR